MLQPIRKGVMLNFMAKLRLLRLKVLRKTNAELEKQIHLQSNLNKLLKEEDEIQRKTNSGN